jgi:hypothetical protein
VHEVGVLYNAPKGLKAVSARIGKVAVFGKKLLGKKKSNNLGVIAKIAAAKAAKPKHHEAVKTDVAEFTDDGVVVPTGRTQLNVLS